MRRVCMPAQRIEGNQDGAGDHNDGGEEEHGSLRHRAAPDLRLLLLLNQRPALVVCSGFDSRTRCAICAQLRYGVVVGPSTFAQGCASKEHGLFRPLFAWSFLAFEVRLLKGELAFRMERYPSCHSRSTHQRANRPKNLCANLRNKRSLDAGPGARKESASRTCRGIVRRSVALGAGREEASFALGISRCPSVTQGSPWIARSPWPLGRGGSKTHQ